MENNSIKNEVEKDGGLVSADFMLKMQDKINTGYKQRDQAIEKMAIAVDCLTNSINDSVNSFNVKPTREELQNDIKDLKTCLVGESGAITKLTNNLIGVDGTLTKIYTYIKYFLLILTVAGGITVIVIELIKFFNNIAKTPIVSG